MNHETLGVGRVTLIAPNDVAKNKFRIIDVREPNEFAGELGHIPGAELVPLATIDHAARGWSRDDALLIVCRSGGRSARAASTLARMGFSRVNDLRGGMLAYTAAGLPTTTSY